LNFCQKFGHRFSKLFSKIVIFKNVPDMVIKIKGLGRRSSLSLVSGHLPPPPPPPPPLVRMLQLDMFPVIWARPAHFSLQCEGFADPGSFLRIDQYVHDSSPDNIQQCTFAVFNSYFLSPLPLSLRAPQSFDLMCRCRH